MNRTKKLISDAFWELLEERPYSKITVRNIVEKCQVNRNTFYYHFEGIPSLAEFTVSEWADEIIRKNYQPDSPMSCVEPLAKECLKRKKALLHIYRSANREEFISSLNRVSRHIVCTFADYVKEKQEIPEEEKEVFIRYYKCAIMGILLDWFDEDGNYDLLAFFETLWKADDAPGANVVRKFV